MLPESNGSVKPLSSAGLDWHCIRQPRQSVPLRQAFLVTLPINTPASSSCTSACSTTPMVASCQFTTKEQMAPEAT